MRLPFPAMSDDRCNIKVDPETFGMLSDHKPDTLTWPRFQRHLLAAWLECPSSEYINRVEAWDRGEA